MQTTIERWKQDVIALVEPAKKQNPQIRKMVADMQQFVRLLPPHIPPPHAAGITEDPPTGYLYWQDEFDFCLEINFHDGVEPVMFAGFCRDTPEYVGYYCDESRKELNKLLMIMEETESCH